MRGLFLLGVAIASCRSSDGTRNVPTKEASAATAATAAQQSDSARQNALLERADRARIQGDSMAPVWIVEISDFECPFCKQWHERTYSALKREFIEPGIVRLAYVNFPLAQHPHALPAAEAAMCAAAQNRFWEMHDAIFNTQEKWVGMGDAGPLYDSLAVAVGVNAPEWRDCMRSTVMRRLINADRGRGLKAGVSSTPSFFVGDEGISGAAPIESFRAAIAKARAKAAAPQPR